MNKMTWFALFLILTGVVGTAPAAPNKYVSIEGEFTFSYPEDWRHIDHRLVDVFLMRSGAGQSTLDYEAAFCPTGADPFWSGLYFFLTVDAGGEFSETEIDSVLNDLKGTFGRNIKYFPVADFLADLKSSTPTYDEATKIVNVASDIVEQGELVKRHILSMKFYEKGLATFYFYAPDSVVEEGKEVLSSVLASFTYGGVDTLLPGEDLEVADLGDLETAADEPEVSGETGGSALMIVFFLIILVVLIVLWLRLRSRR